MLLRDWEGYWVIIFAVVIIAVSLADWFGYATGLWCVACELASQ